MLDIIRPSAMCLAAFLVACAPEVTTARAEQIKKASSQAERLPGEYLLEGTNADQSTYAGSLVIRESGLAYELEWQIGDEAYHGIGLLQGSRLTTVIGENASCTLTAYQIDPSGRLDGPWVAAGQSQTGSELAFPVAGGQEGRAGGEYVVHGVNPDGSSYSGSLRIHSDRGLLRLDWDVVAAYSGLGLERDTRITVLATDDPQAECTVGVYELATDGTLRGDWGTATGKTIDLFGTETATPRGGYRGPPGGTLLVAYDRTTNPDFVQIGQILGESGILEKRAEFFSESLVLPHDIPVVVTECGTPNAFYDPGNRRILLCYEILQLYRDHATQLLDTSVEQAEYVAGNGAAVFFHEVGHALVHALDLPITGREEDAVDDLAIKLLLDLGEEGTRAAMATASSYALMAAEAETDGYEQPLWDEHSLPRQRFYRIVCMVLGSDPETHMEEMVTVGLLPSERAARCPAEYAQSASAWDRLLEPHRRAAS